jgi:exodeoxyribonuclease VII large subunit
MTDTVTVVELLNLIDASIAAALPAPIWVRGEVAEYRRTNRGAAFFRLADVTRPDHSIEVSARGRLMMEIDRSLDAAGVGSLRSGIEVRLKGLVALRQGRSLVQLNLLEVDPTVTAGKLALDKAAIVARLAAEGTLAANGRLDLPLVPLRVGLITSRGSAAHADFMDQLERPGYRFAVRTVEAAMQGENSAPQVVRALNRLSREPVDIVALVRGGGSKLDLSSFDTEIVSRAISLMPIPVITGIGHETDSTVADQAAAIAVKTPSAAAEWIVARVADYAGRIDRARLSIRDQAADAMKRVSSGLDLLLAQFVESRSVLARQTDQLERIGGDILGDSRGAIARHRALLDSMTGTFSAIGVEPTLRRGFALVSRSDGSVVREAVSLAPGERVEVRLAEGSVAMTVEEIL